MLQLVAEQARELTHAETCLVTLDLERGRRVEVVSATEVDTWSRPHEAQVVAAGAASAERDRERPTLTEPLTTLDGRAIGSIEVSSREFTELDAAVLVQLAQMASAALERRRLYGQGP